MVFMLCVPSKYPLCGKEFVAVGGEETSEVGYQLHLFVFFSSGPLIMRMRMKMVLRTKCGDGHDILT